MPPAHSLSENYRGILYMVAAGIGFITSDTLVKLASEELDASINLAESAAP